MSIPISVMLGIFVRFQDVFLYTVFLINSEIRQ